MRIGGWPLVLVLAIGAGGVTADEDGWTAVRLRLAAPPGLTAHAAAPVPPGGPDARLTAPAPDGGPPSARLELLATEPVRTGLPRQRDPVPLPHQLVVRVLDHDGRELYRTHVADPRHLRAETLDATGRLVTADRYRIDAELRVALPADPRAARLEIGTPGTPYGRGEGRSLGSVVLDDAY
jgi:hypothetical protein